MNLYRNAPVHIQTCLRAVQKIKVHISTTVAALNKQTSTEYEIWTLK